MGRSDDRISNHHHCVLLKTEREAKMQKKLNAQLSPHINLEKIKRYSNQIIEGR